LPGQGERAARRCHHKLEGYLDAYIQAAGLRSDRNGPLFRAAIGKTKTLGGGAMSRTDVWYMVRRRASDAGIETRIGCHTFRATGITDLTNGGRIEVAQRMAGHSNAKTTGLYDRRNDDIGVGGSREDRDLSDGEQMRMESVSQIIFEQWVSECMSSWNTTKVATHSPIWTLTPATVAK